MKQLILFFFFIAFCIPGIIKSQSKGAPQKAPNGMYIKSSEQLGKGMISCMLCDDAKRTKNCRNFVCDEVNNICLEMHLGKTSINSVIKTKSIQSISGVKKEKSTTGETLYYISDGIYRTYIRNSGNEIELIGFQESTSSTEAQKAMARQIGFTPFENCNAACNNTESACESRCSSELCKDLCIKSAKVCRANCKLIQVRNVVTVPIKADGLGAIKIF
jgi:hypothetical protein